MSIGRKEDFEASGDVREEGTKKNITVIELRSVADRCAYATTRSAFLVVRSAGENRRCC